MNVRELNQEIIVKEPGRFDVVLSTQIPERSRAFWQKAIDAGYILVNEEVCQEKKTKLKTSDNIAINIPKQAKTVNAIEIIYEDADVVVVNKPTGMLAHNKSHWLPEQSVVESIFDKLEHDKLKDSFRPGIVHRLDRATSGVMIIAKNTETLGYLQKQFANRSVKKKYLAITSSTPKHLEAEVDIALGRDPKTPTSFRADKEGKESRTYYKVIDHDTKHSLVELWPRTGRTHQLRVHMKSVGTPIVGDELYGTETADRLMLHANYLELRLPNGEITAFEAKIPDEITAYFG